MTADVASTARPRWATILLHAGAGGLAFLSVLEAGLEVIGHDDLWWNLATGRYIIEHLRVPTVDVFTYTFAGQPWANFEWLSNLLFFVVYEQLGENWIVWMRVGLIFLVFGVALAFCRMRSGSWLVSLLAVAYGAWVCRPFLDARPQLFTFLLSILLLLILHLYRRNPHRRRARNLLFVIPGILLLWTQLHGGYFFGLLLLGGNLLAETGKRLLGLPAEPLEWKRIRTLAAVTLVSAAAVAVNPWTFEAYVDPLRMSQLVGGPNIFLEVTGEWLRPELFAADRLTPSQFWPFLLLVGLVSLPIAAARWRSFDLNDTGLAAVLALAFALQHRRFIPLFTILTLPLLSYGLNFWIDWWLHGRRERGSWAPGSELPAGARRTRSQAALVTALAGWLLLGALLPARLAALRARYAGDPDSSNTVSGNPLSGSTGSGDTGAGNSLFRTNIHYEYYPERAVRFLREAGISGRMFNLYNWGGFLEFTLPEQKTFIDGRAQMVFEPAFHERYLTARWGYPGWRGVMEDFGVTWALLHTEINAVLLRAMVEDPAWIQVFGDESRAVFLKGGPENRVALHRFRRRELPLPETPRSYLLYARDAGAQGNTGQAFADLARARELAPEDERIRAGYVLALAAAGRPDEAGRLADQELAGRPGSVPLGVALARLTAAAGRDEEALGTLEALFARAPEADEPIDAMLEIDAEAGRRIIEQAYDREPEKPWASYAQGRLAEASGDLERARRFYAIEGRRAAAAGDSARMLRCQHALDRTGGRLK